MAHEFSDTSFDTEVLQSDKVTVVDFWAEWCGPCKMMNPVLDELTKEYGDQVVIGKMNVDDNSEVPFRYGIRAIPTFLVFKGGELVDRLTGAQTKETMKTKINAHLN